MASSENKENDKPKTPKKSRECCKAGDEGEKKKSNVEHRLAIDLIACLKVQGIAKKGGKASSKEEKKEGAKGEVKTKEEEGGLLVPDIKTEPTDIPAYLQIHGQAQGAASDMDAKDKERPIWTATNVDMAKDLINRRLNIARDTVTMFKDNKEEHRSDLSQLLANLPYHTLFVKWRLSFNFPVYTLRIVYGILSRFGSIENMGSLSPNSAFVVFKQEYQACRAIMAPMVGFNNCPIICRWWFLQRYRFPVTDAVDVKREDLVLSDGRLERNSKRHMAQIKRDFWRKAAQLSYDVPSFMP